MTSTSLTAVDADGCSHGRADVTAIQSYNSDTRKNPPMTFVTRTWSTAAALALVASAAAAAPVPRAGAAPLRGLNASPIGSAVAMDVAVRPAVVLRGQEAAVTVTGIAAPTLEVRAAGASVNLGKPLPWTALRFTDGAWHGVLPPSEFRGIYPLELRIRPGLPVWRSEKWLLRVFARGTLSRPTFSTPEGAARWWVRTLPSHATLAAVRRWPPPAYDLRDPRLHQILVLAYNRAGHPSVRDRLGIFVTAVRDGFRGNWRMLEATAVP
jgi:hypothetical protein